MAGTGPPAPTTTPPSPAPTTGVTPDTGPVPTTAVVVVAPGVGLPVPAGWEADGLVLATEFATGASCRSAWVLDQPEASPTSGSPSELRSLVQVCSVTIDDGLSLEQFLAARHGGLDRFAPVTVDGCRGLRSSTGDQTTTYLQTGSHRIEVASAVATTTARRAQRLAEIDTALTGMTCRA